MATLSFTPYHGSEDIGRTNDYISDGHGNVPMERSNRYISDGHGAHTICVGFHCPDTPELATAYMELIRKNYERQHPISPGRTKKPIVHYQFYFSPTGEDNVPPEERVQMTLELIQRTELKDFPALIVPHDNTEDPHTHISLCPFSIDGTKKLSVNNQLIYRLRRESDLICVEHGYSIVECPELFGDKEYFKWFQWVKANNIVKVHPPREQDMTTYKKDRKRSRSYAASKKIQEDKKREQDSYLKKMTGRYTPETANFFYLSPIFYDPKHCHKPLVVRCVDDEGHTLSDLEQRSLAQAVWAHRAVRELTQKGVSNSKYLQSRLLSIKQKSLNAHQLVGKLDIRTQAELVRHMKEVGCDIASLKHHIQQQDAILATSPDDKKAQQRKAAAEKILAERSAEYRHLKEVESTLHPASSEAEWHEYLTRVLGDAAAKKVGFASPEVIERDLRQIASVIGIDENTVEDLIATVKDSTLQTTWVEYHAFMHIRFEDKDRAVLSNLGHQLSNAHSKLTAISQIIEDPLLMDPFSLLFWFLFGSALLKLQSQVLEAEIEALCWEINQQYESSIETVREKQLRIMEAKEAYHASTSQENEASRQQAKARYYATVSKILGRLDVAIEILQQQASGNLNDQLLDTSRRKLTAPGQTKISSRKGYNER